MKTTDKVMFALFIYLLISGMMALANSLNYKGEDCTLRYSDYVFPARLLPCEVQR